MQIIKTAPILLTDEFIQNAKNSITPNWGPLGWVTYKRTYARWLDDQNRSEEWEETVKRVVEGNINLDPRLHVDNVDPLVVDELTFEAEKLFKLIYGLSATPSGRNLWISGTDYQKRNGDALNNCWFIATRPQKYGDSHILPEYLTQDQVAVSMPFSFMFDQLMKGGGVGFSVTQDNIQQIPMVDNNIEVTVLIDENSASYQDSLAQGAVNKAEWLANNSINDVNYYELPDTREGWIIANAQLIDMHFKATNPNHRTHLVLDVSNIRPKGAKIKGFGGTASGPMPLIEMFFDFNDILNSRVGAHLSAVDCTDMGNLIGKTVVAGNVRRSAELALGSYDDEDFITMKQDQEKLYHHRWASNNSIAIDSNFNNYQTVADSILHNGEPGVVNLELSRNYGRMVDGFNPAADEAVEGTNPCGEISLANGEPCNLFEIFPSIAVKQGWNLDEAFELGTRYSKRVTFSDYEWEVSRNAITQNRRIGISMSGIQDWILSEFGNRVVTGFKATTNDQGQTVNEPVYDQRVIDSFNDIYDAVVNADKYYSDELDCNESIKHTTVKPSGTVSKLAGVSEGMHFHYSGYMIQRIRFQDTDPLLPALEKCGYKIEPDIYTKNTMCVEFPLRAANADSDQFADAGSVSMNEQLATQAFLQAYWSDNAVSCTVTFDPENEADQIADLLYQYRKQIKSTSLLPYYGGELQQAPKEPISKEEYENRVNMIKDDVYTVFNQLNATDQKDLELVNQSDCASGACPIR